MNGFRDKHEVGGEREPRLETPRAAGHRPGMSAEASIGQRLDRVYSVSSDIPGEMGRLIQTLDRR